MEVSAARGLEDLVANPVPAVLELAKHLGLCLSTELAESLAGEYSFAANFARTRAVVEQCESLGLNLRDPQTYRHDDHTLLHWNHMRKGRPGGWRDEATPEQIVSLLAACGDWLIRRGYEADCRWAWGPGDASNTNWQEAESAIRKLAESHELDGKQILTLRREIAELNAQFQELQELAARRTKLETLSRFLRNQASRLQILARHPTARSMLKFQFGRERLLALAAREPVSPTQAASSAQPPYGCREE